MNLKIRVELDNAAFDVMPEREIAGILTAVAMRIKDGDTGGKLLDYNGNTCGHFQLVDD